MVVDCREKELSDHGTGFHRLRCRQSCPLSDFLFQVLRCQWPVGSYVGKPSGLARPVAVAPDRICTSCVAMVFASMVKSISMGLTERLISCLCWPQRRHQWAVVSYGLPCQSQ